MPAVVEPFWPGQLVRDLGAMAIVLAVMFVVVARHHGVALEAPADPASSYDARPEWYFYPLFELLKFFPGRAEVVAALGAPLVAGGVLFLLPLVDREAERSPMRRKRFVGAVLLLLFGAVALGVTGMTADARNAGYQKFRVKAEKAAERELMLAQQGVPPPGGLAVEDNDPLSRGRRLYRERCSGCHQLAGEGERRAPDLDGWSSRPWLKAFLQAPDDARFYGATKVRGMKPVRLEGADLDAVVEWIYSQGGGRFDAQAAQKGQQLFGEMTCDDCHETDGKKGGDGPPNLGGRASARWIHDFLSDPSEARFFDGKNHMPKFKDKLSDADLDAIAALLRAEREK